MRVRRVRARVRGVNFMVVFGRDGGFGVRFDVFGNQDGRSLERRKQHLGIEKKEEQPFISSMYISCKLL